LTPFCFQFPHGTSKLICFWFW